MKKFTKALTTLAAGAVLVFIVEQVELALESRLLNKLIAEDDGERISYEEFMATLNNNEVK